MKVYICTTGQYSDYSIAAVFSDEVTANRWRELNDYTYDYPDVQEWEVDAGATILGAESYPYHVRLYPDDKDRAAYAQDSVPELATSGEVAWDKEWGQVVVDLHLWARDPKHAVKIASERYTVAAAEMEGLV